jgi:hypothetical protein
MSRSDPAPVSRRRERLMAGIRQIAARFPR